ncbi:MAG: RdgB/HAM1 family non-canonical purine NTP pyrophosphatase [Gammaproteobacteria bacterium]
MSSQQLVLASSNADKLKEMAALLSGVDIEVVLQSRFAVPDVEETGLSFVENALIKARHAARYTGLPAVADDSGIQVDVLGGAPGILSARYAGEGASDEQNLQLLIEKVTAIQEDRPSACFQCVMVYLRHAGDPMPVIAQGTWQGRIVTQAKGRHGFGYDPIFYLQTHGCTAAELAPAEKNRISHRGQAMRALLQKITALNINLL